MKTISKDQFIAEKQIFTKILINSRMRDITYSDVFCLLFTKYIRIPGRDSNKGVNLNMNFIIDAPIWVGEKSKWEELIKEDNGIIEMDHSILGYEFVNIRYHNLIRVFNVEFLEKYLCIELENGKIVAIAHDCDSYHSWVLEEYGDKEEKIIVFCEGDLMCARNIPEFLLDGTLQEAQNAL